MSMEDILKVLVNSRQQGSSSQQQADPMADLIGNLLGGGQPSMMQQQNQMPQQSGGGLGDMMGLLEMFMGGNNQQSSAMNQTTNNPIMLLLQPFVGKLAKKMNIPPEIAMMVVSFVAHKLLSHHPTSGRDSNSFNLDEMLGQMSSGKIDANLLQNSGMINELSRSTGLDQATAAKSLETALGMFGKQVQGRMKSPSSLNVKSRSSMGGAKKLGSIAKSGKIQKNK